MKERSLPPGEAGRVPMSTGAKVRRANDGDVGAMLAFDLIAASSAARVTLLQNSIAEGDCWVAEAGEEIVAFAILDRSFFDQCFIPLVVVHEHHRRRGYAMMLVRHLEMQCTSEKLFTSTNRSNDPMRRLLIKLSFVESGSIHGLDEGDPEIVYLKRLSPR
jgi:GNAT superfamily N-acetyltransferase